MALSTSAFFSYIPSREEIVQHIALKEGIDADSLPLEVDGTKEPELYAKYDQSRQELIEIEERKPYN